MITEFDLFNEPEKIRKLYIKLIDEFVEFDEEFRKKNNINFFKCINFNIHEYDNTIVVWYHYNENLQKVTMLHFTTEEYERLLKFIEDPELYKSKKKYNL